MAIRRDESLAVRGDDVRVRLSLSSFIVFSKKMLRGRSERELHRVSVFVRLFYHVVHPRVDIVHFSCGNVAVGGSHDGVRGFEREFVSKRRRVVKG